MTIVISFVVKNVNGAYIQMCPIQRRQNIYNAEVKELREDSLFWHRLWVDIGRPPTGVVAAVMRNTRYKYHKAVKDIKRNDLNVRKAKLAEMANESDGRALWDELKRLNRGVKCTTNTLDGHSTNADIVEHLANTLLCFRLKLQQRRN